MWEGKAPAEPGLIRKPGSAGASPSLWLKLASRGARFDSCGCNIAGMESEEVRQKIAVALGHLNAGRVGDAEGVLREVLALDPTNDRAMSEMARVAFMTGRGEAAVELLRGADALNPSVVEHKANLGMVLSNLNRLDEAIAVFRSLLEAQPDRAEIWNNLGVCFRSRKVIVYLGGIRHGFQTLPNSGQRSGDEIGGALMPHAKHHG